MQDAKPKRQSLIPRTLNALGRRLEAIKAKGNAADWKDQQFLLSLQARQKRVLTDHDGTNRAMGRRKVRRKIAAGAYSQYGPQHARARKPLHLAFS